MKGPVRRTEEYVCRCVMDGDRCVRQTNPDAPFCPDCEDRHPGYDTSRVEAVPLPTQVRQ